MLNKWINRKTVSMNYSKVLFDFLFIAIFPILVFSIYKLYTSVTPTLYMLLFSYLTLFIFGLLFFYNFDKSFSNQNYISELINSRYKIYLQTIFCMLFFLFAIAALISLDNRTYTKCLLYYILVSLAALFLGLQIILLKDAHMHFGKIILVQVLILGIIIRSSSFIINPFLLGADTYWHFNIIKYFIIPQGHLDLYAQHYYYFSSYHLSQTIGELIMGQGEYSFNLINISHSAVSILVCYLIGRSLSGEKTGLICALIFSVATPMLTLLISNSSKIGGVTLALFCISLLIIIPNNHNFGRTITLIILAFSAITWHPELLFLIITLGFASILVFIYSSNFRFNISAKLLIVMFIGFIIISIYYFYSHFNFSPVLNKELPQMITIIPFGEINIHFLSQLLFAYVAVSFPVFFIPYYLSYKPNETSYCILILLISLIILHILPFLSIISSIFVLNPERTFTYIQIILLILMANSILNLFNTNKLSHLCSFMLIFSLFSFSSASSYLIGDGNDLFNDAIPKGTTYLSTSNLLVHDFLNKTPFEGIIYSDYETIRYISNPIRGIYNLENRKIAYFPSYGKGYLLLNSVSLGRLKWESTNWGQLIIESNYKNTLYDNGIINVKLY